MSRVRLRRGLTLLEVLIALVLIGLIVSALNAALYGGLYLLKQAEYKSRAMSVASAVMQGYLTKTFESPSLVSTAAPQAWVFGDSADSPVDFRWSARVEESTMGSAAIPYKNVTVNCSYHELTTSRAEGQEKEIRLTNVIVYPLIHALSVQKGFGPKAVPPADYPLAENSYKNITAASSVLEVDFRVPKDLLIYYNLAVKGQGTLVNKDPDKLLAGEFNPTATVYTRCLLDNAAYGVETRTPVWTQPFINNVLLIPSVPKGRHFLQLQWYKDSEAKGQVQLREFEIMVLAYENATH